jgi:hypothetical protein
VRFATFRRPNAANVVNVVNEVVKDVLMRLAYAMKTGERCCSGLSRSTNQSKTKKRETLLYCWLQLPGFQGFGRRRW